MFSCLVNSQNYNYTDRQVILELLTLAGCSQSYEPVVMIKGNNVLLLLGTFIRLLVILYIRRFSSFLHLLDLMIFHLCKI